MGFLHNDINLKTEVFRFIFIVLFGGLPFLSWTQTYEEVVAEAIAAAQTDSLSRSENLFRQALKMSPGDHRNSLVYHNLGHVQELMYWQRTEDTKMLEEALYNYSRAIELQPNSIPMRFSRANFYSNLEQYGKAVADYTKIIERDNRNTDALTYRAFAYYQSRDYDKARTDYEEVLRYKPSDYASQLGVALILQKTYRVGEAIRRMEFLVTEHPDKAELYAVRSSMFVDNGKLDLALTDINRAIELDPASAEYYHQRGAIYGKQGKKKLAQRDFRKASKLNRAPMK